MAAPHDTVHAILRHGGGPVSTMSFSLNAPAAVTAGETLFYGDSGSVPVPDREADSLTAFRAAVSRLAGNISTGTARDPLDVRSGRETVAILAAIEASTQSGTAVPVM
jgi:predicted dehydrogenase